VFINYRGEDSHSYGALLYQDLTGRFGKDLVFLDAESIPAGADFTAELLGRVRSARLLLAVIGPRWLTATDPATGERRIDDPADWIRRELAEAFAAGVRVIPVLTDQADLPREADLPADIAALSRCQSRHLRRREPTADLARIVTDLIGLDPVLAAAARRHDSGPRRPLAAPADDLLRRLATASWNQWTAAANDRRLVHPAPLPIRWRRSTAPVAGPVSATGYPRFDPLPGLTAVTNGDLREGTDEALHRIYGGLPSGRLLLIGPPGAGKTAAAILLLLHALRYREQATPDDQARIPVPVLFTLHGWDPTSGQSVTDWMAGRLAETYPMFHGRGGRRAVTDLLAAGRITCFLDGLDESPHTARRHMLDALADAPFRLLLLARTAEAVAATNHGPLAGAVALQLRPVNPADAATYLRQPLVDPPPAPWRAISDHLAGSADRHHRTSAVSEALSVPLTLSLLRDIYGPADPVDELLDTAQFRTAADIENHLLDQAITAAYTPRPGHPTPRYSVAIAHRTLRYLATQLTEHKTSDLAWWHIPLWTTHRSRLLRGTIGGTLINAVACGLALGLGGGLVTGLAGGLILGLWTGLGGGLIVGLRRGRPNSPTQTTRPRFGSVHPPHSLAGAIYWFVAMLTVGLVVGLAAGPVAGLVIGLVAALILLALIALTRRTEIEESSLGPADVWYHDRNVAFGWWITFLLVALVVSSFVPGLSSGLVFVLSSGLVFVVLAGVVVAIGIGHLAERRGATESWWGSAAIDTALACAFRVK